MSPYRCPSCNAASFTVACGRPCPHCTDAPTVFEIHHLDRTEEAPIDVRS